MAGPTVFAEGGQGILGIILVLIGAASGVGFWISDRRARVPLVPRPAWRSINLRWGAIGSFANTATTSSTITVATLYLQQERGLSPMEAPGTLVSFSLLVIAGSTTASWLISAIGWRRSLGLGLSVIAAGNVTITAWPSTIGIAIAAGLCGLGIGVSSVAATDMGTHVQEPVKASAAGAINTAAQLGTAIGTAAILLIATTINPQYAWTTSAACALIAAIAVGRKADSAHKEHHSPAGHSPSY